MGLRPAAGIPTSLKEVCQAPWGMLTVTRIASSELGKAKATGYRAGSLGLNKLGRGGPREGRYPFFSGLTLTSSQYGGAVPCCLRSENKIQRDRGSAAACELL